MGIAVDWGNTNVIYVPSGELTVVQTSPTRIYDLDLDWFRLQLKDLEDNEEAMPFPKTHNHNTEVSLGGLTYARVVEILDPYTVTFQNGQYAVNLVGANSNVGDKVNVNEVSVRSQNSAGLISSPEIQYSSFLGGVSIDVVNGTAGTVFPIGTPQDPVNNLTDAFLIAEYRGFDTLFIIGDITFTTGTDLSGYTVIGSSQDKTKIYINNGATVEGCEFESASISGNLGKAVVNFFDCRLEDNIYNLENGYMRNCILAGDIHVTGSLVVDILSSYSGIIGDDTPSIDFAGSPCGLGLRDYAGGITLSGMTHPDIEANLDFLSGRCVIDATCTSGTIVVRGTASCEDYSGDGCSVDKEQLRIPASDFQGYVWIDTKAGEAGTEYPLGTQTDPVDNIDDALTIGTEYGVRSFNCRGTLTLTSSHDISGLHFTSKKPYETSIYLQTGNTTNCWFDSVNIGGYFNGSCKLTNCDMLSVGWSNFSGKAKDCSLYYTLTAGPGDDIVITNCEGDTNTVIDFNNISKTIHVRNFAAGETVRNMTSPTDLYMCGHTQGLCIIDSSCTSGTVYIGGVQELFDNSGPNCNVVDYTIARTPIIDGVWDEPMSQHKLAGTFGSGMRFVFHMESGKWKRDGNQMTFYDSGGAVLATFDLYTETGAAAGESDNVFERRRA